MRKERKSFVATNFVLKMDVSLTLIYVFHVVSPQIDPTNTSLIDPPLLDSPLIRLKKNKGSIKTTANIKIYS